MLSLNHGEAVHFNNQLLIGFKGNLSVDGAIIENGSYNARTCIVSEGATLELVTTKSRIIRGYILEGEEVSVGDISKFVAAIRGPYVDEDGDLEFGGDLDLEFKVRKELRQYEGLEVVWDEAIEVREPFEYTIIGSLEDTGSDYITTAVQVGLKQFKNSRGGIYEVSVGTIKANTWNDLTKKYEGTLKLEAASHSGLRYHKVDSKYAFNDNEEKGSNVRYTKTLQEAKDLEKSTMDYVTKIVESHLPKSLSGTTIAEIRAKVNSINTCLAKVDSKQKTYRDKQSTVKLVGELDKYLLSLV